MKLFQLLREAEIEDVPKVIKNGSNIETVVAELKWSVKVSGSKRTSCKLQVLVELKKKKGSKDGDLGDGNRPPGQDIV